MPTQRPYYDTRPAEKLATEEDRLGRTLVTTAVLAVIVTFAFGFWLIGGVKPNLVHCSPPRFETVSADRMVYDIARTAVRGTNQDVRDMSNDILDFNNLDGGSAIPNGMKVEVPCYG